MRDSYEDAPGQAREAGLHRLGRLTWRTTQIGALATVGFAIVFARTAPAKTVSVQTPALPAKATHAPAPAPKHHPVKPRRTASSPGATQPAVQQTVQQTAQPAAQPAASPTPQSAAPSPTPSLAPPTTAPAPAPSTSSPVPTVTSTSHGGN